MKDADHRAALRRRPGRPGRSSLRAIRNSRPDSAAAAIRRIVMRGFGTLSAQRGSPQFRHERRLIDVPAVSLALATAALLGVSIVFLLGSRARASSPPAGSPQADMMAPYSEWIRGLTNPNTGQGCCSLSDCRVVDYRLTRDGYEAFIDKATFPGAPDAWVRVPDYVILHRENPTGFAVACWAAWHKQSDGFFCFTPSSGA